MKVTAIGKNYAKLCEKGKRNFFSVPEDRQDEVRYIIEDIDGYVINEDGTVTKPVVEEVEQEENGMI